VRELRVVGSYCGRRSWAWFSAGSLRKLRELRGWRFCRETELAGWQCCGMRTTADPAGKASDRDYRAVESAGLFLGFITALPKPPPTGSLVPSGLSGPPTVPRTATLTSVCSTTSPLWVVLHFCRAIADIATNSIRPQGERLAGTLLDPKQSKPTGQSVGSRWKHRSPL